MNSILGFALRAIEHDFRGAERIAAMHECDVTAEACEEVGLFHGGIAAAHHHDLFVAIKEAIAGGAGTDTVADQLLFGGQIEPAGLGAGSDDEGPGFDPLTVDLEAEWAL